MIGIIDADLLGRNKHRFPNLACEKIAGYWLDKGHEVRLLTEYSDFSEFEKVYISKVFTDTPIPEIFLDQPNVIIGGTGFYFDKAPNLPSEIEHHMPYYSLYDDWIEKEVAKAKDAAALKRKEFKESVFRAQFKEYTDYSIGFLTRGCFRKCGFCVNKKYDHAFCASRLNEFFDPDRKKLCFLDDNFFSIGPKIWKPILEEVIETGKPFKFKQGLDERLLNDDICRTLFNTNYDGDFTFAFDNISDYDLIHRKLELIRKYTDNTRIKFYVLVGYEGIDAEDIENAFKRIHLLMQYHCLPYIMRYQNENESPWKSSKYRSVYIQLARWCNQPSFFKKMSFRQYCEANQARIKTDRISVPMQALTSFEQEHPKIAEKYFDLRFDDFR